MSQLGLSNESKSPVRILPRPKPDQLDKSKKSPSELNVNSQPFVPRNIGAPIIQMEESTRTQCPPKLVILKREKPPNTGNCIESRPIGSGHGKSYEERQAEYKKARERILGSASPSNDEASTVVTAVTSSSRPPSLKPALLPTNAEVPRLLRQPQGPSSTGGRGFSHKKWSSLCVLVK